MFSGKKVAVLAGVIKENNKRKYEPAGEWAVKKKKAAVLSYRIINRGFHQPHMQVTHNGGITIV